MTKRPRNIEVAPQADQTNAAWSATVDALSAADNTWCADHSKAPVDQAVAWIEKAGRALQRSKEAGRTVSKKEFSSNVIDLRDGSRIEELKLTSTKELTALARHFAKHGWFFIYKSRMGEDFVYFSAAIDPAKDLPKVLRRQEVVFDE